MNAIFNLKTPPPSRNAIVFIGNAINRVSTMILLCLFSFGNLHATPRPQTGDSTGKYLTIKDTIFITPVKENGGFTFVFDHKFVNKQTAYSLSKFHGRFVEELIPYNAGLKIGRASCRERV